MPRLKPGQKTLANKAEKVLYTSNLYEIAPKDNEDSKIFQYSIEIEPSIP
jgi:hypothetical protein